MKTITTLCSLALIACANSFLLGGNFQDYNYCKTHNGRSTSMIEMQDRSTSILKNDTEEKTTHSNVENDDFIGSWSGELALMGKRLRIVFNITSDDSGIVATMDSPDQGVYTIKVDGLVIQDSVITMQVNIAGITYKGKLSGAQIRGTFCQGSQVFPLDLQKTSNKAVLPKRPQEPQPPFPYHVEDVVFKNEVADFYLAGTITLPKSETAVPGIVLISGSGPQDRNEEIMAHKPFLVIADHLTRNGIGVLRFDDRGVGKSEGIFKGSTPQDFATDVRAAVNYLRTRKEIDHRYIGLIGHSEGGIIAPMVAAEDNQIAFIILLAGTGIPGDQILLMQMELIGKINGISEEEIRNTIDLNRRLFEVIRNTSDPIERNTKLRSLINEAISHGAIDIPEGMTPDEIEEMQMRLISDPWIQFFLVYDPATALMRVTCPVLALNGDKDLQVSSDINLKMIRNALEKGGNKDVTTVELPGLNHLFQHCETGAPAQYGLLEETCAVHVLELMTDWIKEKTNIPSPTIKGKEEP